MQGALHPKLKILDETLAAITLHLFNLVTYWEFNVAQHPR